MHMTLDSVHSSTKKEKKEEFFFSTLISLKILK